MNWLWEKIKSYFKGKSEDELLISHLQTNGTVSGETMQLALGNIILRDVLQERKTERQWRLFKRIGFSLIVVLGLVSSLFFQASFFGYSLGPSQPVVGVVRIQGAMSGKNLASAEKIIYALQKAFESQHTTGIILAIDSPGGAPVEAERINAALETLRKRFPQKPIYAVIENVGASAAYMVALRTDRIYAGKYSLVGSVGAVMSAWDVSKGLAKFDVYQRVYSSGELKSMLNPFVPTTPTAEKKAQSLVDLMGQRFVRELEERRGPLLKKNTNYGTGEIWDGETAKALGLIDHIGTIETVAAGLNGKTHDFGPRNSAMDSLKTTAIGLFSEPSVDSLAPAIR